MMHTNSSRTKIIAYTLSILLPVIALASLFTSCENQGETSETKFERQFSTELKELEMLENQENEKR